MPSDFDSVFTALRAILQKHASQLEVTQDTAGAYCLEAVPGPATLRAWGGKMKRPTIPVAWLNVGKAYVSYHLMGVYDNARLHSSMSRELKSRMQGKTCFNFKSKDDALFAELAKVTEASLAAFRKAGFASEPSGQRMA